MPKDEKKPEEAKLEKPITPGVVVEPMPKVEHVMPFGEIISPKRGDVVMPSDIKLMSVIEMRAHFKGDEALQYAASNGIAVAVKTELAACEAIYSFYHNT